MQVEIQKEHQWLQKLAGEWISECEMSMEPGAPPVKMIGTEVIRPIGEAWILAEGKADMPGGGTGLTMLTLGYDTDKKQIVGSWFGSMMTYLWTYTGVLEGNTLTLRTEGPNCMGGGGTAQFKEVIELKSDSHRTFSSYIQGEDGAWTQMMTVNYKRK